MLLIIDNFDSFTYNLVQYFGELGATPVVFRSNAITIPEIDALRPERIVISPGPGRPEDAGVSEDVIRAFAGKLPILGVCLGHQAIGHVFGGRVVRAPRPRHGKVSSIEHDGKGLFQGLRGAFDAGRYHSLAVAEDGWPADLEVTARAAGDGVVMALRHRTWQVHGVQFHPESVLTPEGRHLLRNFLNLK
ncbi:MAG: aminodeoxychorismate/anthranilate synthase component II [Acidobacteria bacterium]|nr:aminodeoxychorismate/anthranilate synthase component II [Acidobacteriota bacterium]